MTRFRCFACGQFTDEVKDGPTPEEVDQAFRWQTGVLEVWQDGFYPKAAVVCWKCFWKTEPDMWISERQWRALNPIVSWLYLPLIKDNIQNIWEPQLYPWPPVVRCPH